MGCVLHERVTHGAAAPIRVAAVGGWSVAPGVGLGVEIVEIGELAGGKERVPDEPDRSATGRGSKR
jgi:hypothetical protein